MSVTSPVTNTAVYSVQHCIVFQLIVLFYSPKGAKKIKTKLKSEQILHLTSPDQEEKHMIF